MTSSVSVSEYAEQLQLTGRIRTSLAALVHGANAYLSPRLLSLSLSCIPPSIIVHVSITAIVRYRATQTIGGGYFGIE
jgi:hypothetical protein